MTLGIRLRALRKERSYTLVDTAARAGISTPFLSEVERDQAAPTLETLVKIAKALYLPTLIVLDGVDGFDGHVHTADPDVFATLELLDKQAIPADTPDYATEFGVGRPTRAERLTWLLSDRRRLQIALGDAAREIDVKGPVDHRIRVLRQELSDSIITLETALRDIVGLAREGEEGTTLGQICALAGAALDSDKGRLS